MSFSSISLAVLCCSTSHILVFISSLMEREQVVLLAYLDAALHNNMFSAVSLSQSPLNNHVWDCSKRACTMQKHPGLMKRSQGMISWALLCQPVMVLSFEQAFCGTTLRFSSNTLGSFGKGTSQAISESEKQNAMLLPTTEWQPDGSVIHLVNERDLEIFLRKLNAATKSLEHSQHFASLGNPSKHCTEKPCTL